MTEPEPAAAPSAGRSFRPGDWFGIFGEHATVVLPPSEKARVAAIWALVDDGAGFDEVLDALIATGLRDLPGFVLVSEDGEDTKVVIRGAAHAEFTTADETVTVEGSSATTWAERSLTGVRAMRIEVAAGDGTDDLVIRDGLVRISRTDRPAVSGLADPLEDRTLDPTPAPAPAAPPAPVPEPEPEPVPEAPAQETPLDDPPTQLQELSATEEAGWSQPVPIPAAAPEPVTDHDGPTRAGNWEPTPPGFPGRPGPPGVLASPVARLVFSSGEVVDVDRVVVVGRAPEARRFTPTEQPRLVPVPSPHQEISATHLEIRPGAGADHGSAVVTDLGSTNGTVLVQPGLPAEDLQPGIAVQLIPGAILDLGDGVTIQVGHA